LHCIFALSYDILPFSSSPPFFIFCGCFVDEFLVSFPDHDCEYIACVISSFWQCFSSVYVSLVIEMLLELDMRSVYFIASVYDFSLSIAYLPVRFGLPFLRDLDWLGNAVFTKVSL
jgi:hypothetical protein